MERFPQENEANQQERSRHVLSFDALGDSGNVFWIIANAQALLEGDNREHFTRNMWEATTPDAGKNYDDILALVNEHVELIDTSNHYPQYGRDNKVTAAVERLNEQLATLPDTTPCHLEGLYPDFDDSDLSPAMYAAFLADELRRVDAEVAQADADKRESLEQLSSMLLGCMYALRRIGVT